MGMKHKVTKKMLQTTSDKISLNKKLLTLNQSLAEVSKILGENPSKSKK